MSLPERARASVVCVDASRLLCVQLRDPATGIARLFPPGGKIEPDESPLMAAEREALEETGYRVVADPARKCVAHYPYTWNGVERSIATHFFAARLADPEQPPAPVDDVHYNETTIWLPIDQLEQALGFQRDILAAVRSLLPI
ncbi:MAG TPA: NUDIX domain-containing protein [Polyangiales bacterium]|nr:NUDIX domain-containing protein [Polyangiales bacterium]